MGDCFTFNKKVKQNDHNNSSPQLHSDSNAAQSKPLAKSPDKSKSHDEEKTKVVQSKPPAKSQSKRKKSEGEDKTSRKPKKSKSQDEEKTKFSYYTLYSKSKNVVDLLVLMLVQMQDSKQKCVLLFKCHPSVPCKLYFFL